jgi:hypothetical protein
MSWTMIWVLGGGATWLMAVIDWAITPRDERKWLWDRATKDGLPRGTGWDVATWFASTLLWLACWPVLAPLMAWCWVARRRTIGSQTWVLLRAMTDARARKDELWARWEHERDRTDALMDRGNALLDRVLPLQRDDRLERMEDLDAATEEMETAKGLVDEAKAGRERMNDLEAQMDAIGTFG